MAKSNNIEWTLSKEIRHKEPYYRFHAWESTRTEVKTVFDVEGKSVKAIYKQVMGFDKNIIDLINEK